LICDKCEKEIGPQSYFTNEKGENFHNPKCTPKKRKFLKKDNGLA